MRYIDKNHNAINRILIFLSVIFISVFVTGNSLRVEATPPTPSFVVSMDFPDLDPEEIPRVGDVLDVNITATGRMVDVAGTRNVVLELNLPEEVELVGQPVYWEGVLGKGETMEFSTKIKINKLPFSSPVEAVLSRGSEKGIFRWDPPVENLPDSDLPRMIPSDLSSLDQSGWWHQSSRYKILEKHQGCPEVGYRPVPDVCEGPTGVYYTIFGTELAYLKKYVCVSILLGVVLFLLLHFGSKKLGRPKRIVVSVATSLGFVIVLFFLLALLFPVRVLY